MNDKKWTVGYMIARWCYRKFVRDLVLSAVEDPKKEWDNNMMQALDFLFGVEP